MKVISFDKILEEFDKPVNNTIKKTIFSNYFTQNKSTKQMKKKTILSKIIFNLDLKKTSVTYEDTRLKAILIGLNKLNTENKGEIVSDLKSVEVQTFDVLWKITDFIYKKILNEPNYADLYLGIIEKLSQTWIADFKDSRHIDLKEALIVKLQEQFEEHILLCDKNIGTKIIQFVAKLHEYHWIPNEVVENILRIFLVSNDLILIEYTIVLIKHTTLSNKIEFVGELKKHKLPMRLTFMLEEI